VGNLALPEGLQKLPPTRVIAILLCAAVLHRALKPTAFATFRVVGTIYSTFVLLAIISAAASQLGTASLIRGLAYIEPFLWLIIGVAAGSDGPPVRAISLALGGVAAALVVIVVCGVPEFALQVNPLHAAGLGENPADYMFDRRLGFSGRLVSTLGQPVYAGLFAALAVSFTVFRTSVITRGMPEAVRGIALATGGTLFMFLTGTRAAIVGLALVPLAYYAILRRWRAVACVAGLYVVLVTVALTIMPSRIVEYWQESVMLEQLTSGSTNVLGRVSLTLRMYELFRQHPVLGVGPGFFQKAETGGHTGDVEGLSGVENQYATILAENGAIGGVLFVAFITMLIVILIRRGALSPHSLSGRYCALCAAALISLALMAASCFVLTTTPMFIMMGLAGCALGASQALSSPAGEAKMRTTPPSAHALGHGSRQ